MPSDRFEFSANLSPGTFIRSSIMEKNKNEKLLISTDAIRAARRTESKTTKPGQTRAGLIDTLKAIVCATSISAAICRANK
jgi:hypothetical protein